MHHNESRATKLNRDLFCFISLNNLQCHCVCISGCILQTRQLADMKVLLRDSAERERTLMQEKQDLEEKVVCALTVTSTSIYRPFF